MESVSVTAEFYLISLNIYHITMYLQSL